MARHAYSRRYGTKKQSWLDGEAHGRFHTLDELYEYYVSLDVAISKIRSGLLLGRSSFLKETRDRNKTEQAMQSLFPMMFQIILVTATPFANVFTQLPIRPVTNADDSLAYWGINQRVAEERRWLLSAMWRYRTRVQWARSTGIQENSQSE